jgi:hypothetical protein
MMARLNIHVFRPNRGLVTALGLFAILMVLTTAASAQTSIPGSAIDLEIVNPSDGTNSFCVAPGDTLTARLFVRPGNQTTSCTPSCGSVVSGGTAHIATAVVDIAFDNQKLNLVTHTNNTGTTAVDGLIQNNATQGRIGWALAGDWTPDADTSGTLAAPCDMQLLESANWVLETQFTAQPTASGMTTLHLRREGEGFALSFADICSDEAMTMASGDIDEIIDGTVLVSASCTSVLFFDGFEDGTVGRWSSSAGS